MTRALALTSFLSIVGLFGCSAGGDPQGMEDPGSMMPGAGGGGPGSGTGSGSTGSGPSTGPGGGGRPETGGTLGVVVIDVQETFVSGAANADIDAILDHTKSVFQLAAADSVPFFMTFEDSQQGDHALHAPLQPVIPPQAKQFIKTTFDATGQPDFHQTVQASGLSHLVVLGSETDVCVLQTVLGLRSMGFTVLLQKDAVFTSEPNTSPAVRRMTQAGAMLVDLPEVTHYAATPGDLPKGNTAAVKIVSPLHMGVVLNDFSDASVGASSDSLKTQKSARLQQLLLISEWFSLPVYTAGGLPSQFATYFQGQVRPISQIAQDASVQQLVFAGTDGDLATLLGAWIGSRDVFVMEDALLAEGTAADQAALLKPYYDQGLVPTTYKSFYYDMTKSVDLNQWPSQDWIDKYDEYYAITEAPEDLPAMPAD